MTAEATSTESTAQALTRARSLRRAGDGQGSDAICREVLARAPDSLGARIGLAESALDRGDGAGALGHADAALRIAPEDAFVAALRARALVRAGRAEDAAAELAPLARAHPDDAALRGALAAALRACGRDADAAAHDAASLTADPAGSGPALRTAERALKAAAPGAALAALAPALARRPDDPVLLAAQADASLALGDRSAAIAALARALRARPGDIRLRARLAVVQAEAGRADAALETLAPLIAEGAPPRAVLGHLARASLSLGRPVCGLDAFRAWFADAPARPEALEALQIMLRLSGRFEDASAAGRRHLRARPRLPLAAVLADPPPCAANDAALALGWAHSDQSRGTFAQWRARALHGAAAGRALRDHVLRMEFEPSARAELSALCDPPDWTPVRDAHAAGRGCLLAAIHHGPTHALAPMLAEAGLPVHMVSSVAGPGGGPAGVTYLGASQSGVLRDLARRLRQGGVIGLAPDLHDGASAELVPCLDGMIGVSTLMPRLAFMTGAPSFQAVAQWREGRITASLTPLPAPGENETREAFITRWRREYAARLSAHLCAEPENIAFGAMWQRLAATTRREFAP